MATTPTHGLPYPQPADAATPHTDIRKLAEAVARELDQINPTQITGVTAGRLLIANSSGKVTGVAMSGDTTITPTGAVTIGSGRVGTSKLADKAVTTGKLDDGAVTTAKISPLSITDYRVASDAKIALTKLADVPPGQIPVGDSGSNLRAREMSGDASLSSSGVLTIGPGAVTPSKIADGAVTLPKIGGWLKTVRFQLNAVTPGPKNLFWPAAFPSSNYLVLVAGYPRDEGNARVTGSSPVNRSEFTVQISGNSADFVVDAVGIHLG